MSWNRIARGTVVATMSLAIGLGLTACTRDYTVAYVYMTTAPKNGQGGAIAEYAVDYQSGALVTLTGSPIATGNNPVTLVAAPSGLFIYVLNHDDSTVQEFAVGSDGGLTSKNTYKTTGALPTAATIDATGKFLYVTYTYQTGFSAVTPGPGGVSIFPISADNSLGTPLNQNVGNNPVGVVTNSFNNFLYVVDQEASPNATVLGFARNTTTGTLTPVPGTTITQTPPNGPTVAKGFAAGVTPSAIAEDPKGHFVYVTDKAANQLIGYVVQAQGALTPMVNGPFATGLFPVSVTIDPRGKSFTQPTSMPIRWEPMPSSRAAAPLPAPSARDRSRSAPLHPASPSNPPWESTCTPQTVWMEPSPVKSSIHTMELSRRSRTLPSLPPAFRPALWL